MSQTPDGDDTQPIDSPRPPGPQAEAPEPDVPPSATAGYGAAPAPGERDVTRPDLGDPQRPGSAETPGAGPSTEPPDPAAAPRRSRPRTVVIVAIVVGVLMVLAIVLGGLWLLSSNRTTDAPGDDGASSEPASEDAGGEAPASACTDELCTQAGATVGEAHVSSDGVEWALDGSWSDVVDAPADAAGSGTAVYTSEAGTVTLTVVGFDDADQAQAYAEDLMAELGEPYDTGVVWDDPPEGRDAGELNRFSDDDVETAVWYDSSGQVWTLEGAPGTEPPAVFGFYYTLPPV